jgi:hypothetical protein
LSGEYFIGKIFIFLLKNRVKQQSDLFNVGVMPAGFKGIKNGSENNRYQQARSKDSDIDFES